MLTIVSYHHFADQPDALTAGLGVTTSPARFADHLAFYRRWFNPVSLEAVITGSLPPRALLLTIDDAFRSVLMVALPLLQAAKMPATLFTNSRIVAGNYVPLDSIVTLSFAQLGAPTVAVIVAAVLPTVAVQLPLAAVIGTVLPQLTVDQREELRARLLAALATSDATLCRDKPFLSAADLGTLVRAGVTIGNHTASHVHGRSLAGSALVTEIDGSKARLEAMTGQPISAFSFPYGNLHDATAPVLKQLRSSGHRALFLVQARANHSRPAADLWFRTPMQNDPVAALPAKLAVLPRLRSWRADLSARTAAVL
jgi:peptidoglycan/xylan/chitin deacetylase (PgdA/CDA1 family)